MGKKYKYKFTLSATYDMISAENYILNSLRNEKASIDLASNIKKTVDLVCERPMLNNDCEYYGIKNQNNRYIKVKNYNLFYYVDEIKKEVVFLRFLYNRMNIKKKDIK